MLLKVISGGQIGIDQSSLAAAHDLGITTGGWAPKGYRTKYGFRPELKLLGVKEHSSYKYPPRTILNIKESDGTLRLAYDFTTTGERLTLKGIQQNEKPYYDVDLNDMNFCFDVADWIIKNNIQILNVAGNAGNSYKESQKIFKVGRNYLRAIFRACI